MLPCKENVQKFEKKQFLIWPKNFQKSYRWRWWLFVRWL